MNQRNVEKLAEVVDLGVAEHLTRLGVLHPDALTGSECRQIASQCATRAMDVEWLDDFREECKRIARVGGE